MLNTIKRVIGLWKRCRASSVPLEAVLDGIDDAIDFFEQWHTTLEAIENSPVMEPEQFTQLETKGNHYARDHQQ